MSITLPRTKLIPPAKTGAPTSTSALLSACFGGMFDGFDASIYVLVLFPALSDLLHTQSHEVVAPIGAMILAIFMVGWAGGAIIFGMLSDRFGRVRTMTWSILLYAIASGLCAISHSWQELAIYRFLVGLGIGGEMGAGAVFLSEFFQGKNRYRALSLMTAAIAAGYLLSAVANFACGSMGWRYVFLCGLGPALMALYMRLRLRGCDRALAHITEQPRVSPLQLLFSKHLRKSIVVLVLASVAIVNWWAVLSWVPAWVNRLTGSRAGTEISVVSFSMYLGSILSCLCAVSMLPVLRRRRSLAIAFAGSLALDLLMFLCVKTYGIALIVLAFGAGAFAGLPFLFLYTTVPELFPATVRGTAFGISIQTGRTLAAAAALVGGQLIAAFHGSYPIAGSFVALSNALGFLVAWLIPEDENYLALESSRSLMAPTSKSESVCSLWRSRSSPTRSKSGK